MSYLITAGLALPASIILALFVAIVRRDGAHPAAQPQPTSEPVEHRGATGDWSPATELAAKEAKEQAALAVAAEAAAEMPPDLTVDPVDVLRTLSPAWHDLVVPGLVPELAVDGLPVLPAHGPMSGHQPGCPGCVQAALDYHGRHNIDTVEMVLPGWAPPIGARRIALLTDTQPIEAVRDAGR